MRKVTASDISRLQKIIRDLDKEEAEFERIYGSSENYSAGSIRLVNIKNNATLKTVYAYLTKGEK